MSALPPSPFLFASNNSPDAKSPADRSRPQVSRSAGVTLSRDCASKAPGPSLATGMSSAPANVGGEHEEVAQRPIEKIEGNGGIETTSLTAVGAKCVDEKHSGTAPGSSGPERDGLGAPNSESFSCPETKSGVGSARWTSAMLHPGVVDGSTALTLQARTAVTAGETAPNSNSGDGLGNLEPGSNTWGGGNATAPSGRADESAICPAVAGSSSHLEDSRSAFALAMSLLHADWSYRVGRLANTTQFRTAVASEMKSASE